MVIKLATLKIDLFFNEIFVRHLKNASSFVPSVIKELFMIDPQVALPPTGQTDQIFVVNFETNDVSLCPMTPFRIAGPVETFLLTLLTSAQLKG